MPEVDLETNGNVAFGPFRMNRAGRLIERSGEAVPLGSRAFDILACLLEHAGQVVGKTELLRQVWPNSIVEEGSLRFHINALRKALGEGRYIANIAGQGYSFVAPVSRIPGQPSVEVRPMSARLLPARPHRLVGRDEVLRTLGEQLLEHRFVTVAGPGGVGKTSVALALSHDLAAQFDGDICFFDVGSVFKSELFAGGLASALGISMQPGSAAPGIITFLERRRMLLVLDGCESAVDAAAALAERIFRETPHVHLLITSREALRADGEHVHRLLPLEYPAPGTGRTAEEASEFSAVQLFVERAASSLNGFVLTDDEAPLVSTICRKLDGLALAIELAAGRIGAFGVGEVAQQLESQFALMWPARRTAVARHQTLSATLGWSYHLLTAREQLIFRRLSVFAAGFTLQMATAVVTDETVPQAEATELLGSLVAKSLVQFTMNGAYSTYRLLDTTRSYAFDKLGEVDEVRKMAERHAQLILRLLEDGAVGQNGHGVKHLNTLLEDVDAAIEWSLSQDGNQAASLFLAH
jgi:predicted ATPase/DNA-binding winged helix-turn-helix (wHTH) protein